MEVDKRKQELENRLKVVEITSKINSVREEAKKAAFEEEKRKLELERLKLEHEVLKKQSDDKMKGVGMFEDKANRIRSAITTHIVDNDQTVIGSEPAIVNIWDKNELETLKKKLLDAI